MYIGIKQEYFFFFSSKMQPCYSTKAFVSHRHSSEEILSGLVRLTRCISRIESQTDLLQQVVWGRVIAMSISNYWWLHYVQIQKKSVTCRWGKTHGLSSLCRHFIFTLMCFCWFCAIELIRSFKRYRSGPGKTRVFVFSLLIFSPR